MATMTQSNGHRQYEAAPHSEPAGSGWSEVYGLASRFFQGGMEQYDDMIVGEERAKRMFLALLAMGAQDGMAGIVIGEPGGGKSAIIENGETIVDGLGKDTAAKVPHKVDLSPSKLVGETNGYEKKVQREGEPAYLEALASKLEAIIRPGIRVVKFDEITRTSPYALNAALGILQDGRIEGMADGFKVEFSEFDLVISGMNNYGTAFTNRLDPAVVSRHAMGAFMGVRSRGKLSEVGEAVWDNPSKRFSPKPAEKTVVNLEELQQIREAIQNVPIYDSERKFGKRAQALMLDSLEHNGIREADARPAIQIVRISQALAMSRAHKEVTEEDIREAVRYSMTARLGIKGEQEDQIDKEVDRLMDHAAATA